MTVEADMNVKADKNVEVDRDRRSILSGSSLLMAGGLFAGYGTFFAMAGRYFYPSNRSKDWLFVANESSFAMGESRPFVSPTGVAVTITCRGDGVASQDGSGQDDSNGAVDTSGSLDRSADRFVALSNICPHLGCRVHWEAHNGRFFCPCHNGAFDSSGKAIAGPPKTAGQTLPEYPLKVVDGSLYIEMSIESVRKLSS